MVRNKNYVIIMFIFLFLSNNSIPLVVVASEQVTPNIFFVYELVIKNRGFLFDTSSLKKLASTNSLFRQKCRAVCAEIGRKIDTVYWNEKLCATVMLFCCKHHSDECGCWETAPRYPALLKINDKAGVLLPSSYTIKFRDSVKDYLYETSKFSSLGTLSDVMEKDLIFTLKPELNKYRELWGTFLTADYLSQKEWQLGDHGFRYNYL